MRGQRTFGRGLTQAMNEAAQRRLRNPPPKPYAGWTFAAAAVVGVVARVIFLTDGPLPLAQVLMVIAVALAAVSFWLRLRRWWKSRARK
ncbi:hypothetical protein ART_1326 [Arthrobacter sp. PAMC 25486]|uniref:hypothetical protein n=1 Tax=Arthrobacter sp. PAMC 25486 TaxID=1494608 RepID=UPI0005359FE4|nr:hypothetical protein [Arthrobacter sp. PAMC 25486]AIY00925.1 hypothetical protein ART_1326 [Arthrobacter sp. PAMC 25486]